MLNAPANHDLFVQLIGFVALGLSFLVFQINKRSQMLLLQMIAALIWASHFFLLGALTGAAINLLTAFRNYVFYKSSRTRDPIIPLVFIALFGLAVFLTWEGLYSLLPLAGSVIGTLAFWQVKTHNIRLIVGLGPFCWLLYNVFYSGSYAAIITDVATLLSLIIGIYRFDIKASGRLATQKQK